jgi:hypothetical protein
MLGVYSFFWKYFGIVTVYMVLEWGRRHENDFPVSVGSLGVPTSPVPHVPRHRTGHIRGLVSTERTHSHENHSHTFCVLVKLT